jgi:poly-gamma-glutamate synthesis protein (capsule biosynthesis protein)
VLHWNRYERTGCLFIAELDESRLLRSQRIPTFDDGRMIGLHPKPWGKRHLRNVDGLLNRDITPARYRREAFRVRTVKPILAHLQWSRIGKLRFSHLSKGLGLIFRRNKPV